MTRGGRGLLAQGLPDTDSPGKNRWRKSNAEKVQKLPAHKSLVTQVVQPAQVQDNRHRLWPVTATAIQDTRHRLSCWTQLTYPCRSHR